MNEWTVAGGLTRFKIIEKASTGGTVLDEVVSVPFLAVVFVHVFHPCCNVERLVRERAIHRCVGGESPQSPFCEYCSVSADPSRGCQFPMFVSTIDHVERA